MNSEELSSSEIAATYRAYIGCLNARNWGSLGDFLAEDARHNGRSFGVSGYRQMLEKDVDDIPDLRFNIGLMTCEPPLVAARLNFDCAPRGLFMGLAVNGRRITFVEHVFYQFSGGKICEVWSVIDKSAIEQQL